MVKIRRAKLLLIAWQVLIGGTAIVGTIGMSTSQWLTKSNVVNPLTLSIVDTAECGISTYCIKDTDSANRVEGFSFGPFCATRYGGSLTSIPSSQWRMATGVGIVTMLLFWLCFVWSLLLCCCCKQSLHQVRNIPPVATSLLIAVVVVAAWGFDDLAQPAIVGYSVCQMCTGASSFNTGDCSLGTGFYLSIVSIILAIIASGLGYVVRTDEEFHVRVKPLDSANPNRIQVHGAEESNF